jgi:hypothetical protein
MKKDVLNALSGVFPERVPCKETLNHPGIIKHVSGINVFEDTSKAFDIAYHKLGIDIHCPLPVQNAPRAKAPNGTWTEGNTRFSDMGVYHTTTPIEYCRGIDKNRPEWVFEYDPSHEGFMTNGKSNVACEWELHATFRNSGGLQGHGRLGTAQQLYEISRNFRSHHRDEAVMYHLYYTMLFMWPVVTFGWEAFMTSAALWPDKFDECSWRPWSQLSREYFKAAAQLEDEVLFTHDDLVIRAGPVFSPDFYEKYIFPRYEYILEPAVKAGKKIVFVCDGNMQVFLERLLDFAFDGIMFENPATSFDRVCEIWGNAGRGFIGGISTDVLTNGTAEQVRAHTTEVIEKGSQYPGFIISSCGGLHGNIPMNNMLAYFETRDEMGIPAQL